VGKFDSIRAYNKEFTRWLLQVPLMGHVERLFHYSQGLKRHIRIEVERADCDTLHDAMKVADKLDSIYSQNSIQRSGYDRGSYKRFQNHHPTSFPSHSIGRGKNGNGPTPMQIGNISQRTYKRNFLSFAERKRHMDEKLCFVCHKPNCHASNHRGEARKN